MKKVSHYLLISIPLASAVVLIVLGSVCLAAKGQSGRVSLRIATYPPQLSASVDFEEPSGNKALDAGEDGKIIVTLRNSGRGDAFDVRVNIQRLSDVKGLSLSRSVEVGTVGADSTKKVEIGVSATEEVDSGRCGLKLTFPEGNGFDADPITLSFDTRELVPPEIVVADVGVDDFSQNGRIEPGETAEVTVRIYNRGGGEARRVTADVSVGENVFLLPDYKTHFNLGNLGSGEYKDIKIGIVTNKRIRTKTIPVKVRLTEARPRFSKELTLNQLALNAPQRRPEEIAITGLPRKPHRRKKAEPPSLSVDVDVNVPETGKKNRYGVAVIIGNMDYRSKDVPPVEFAIRDAAVMKEYVVKALGYRPGNIIYCENATQAKFRSMFGTEIEHRGRLYDYVKPGKSDVYIYYSGHGAPDPESKNGYFVPVDCDPSAVRLNGYSLETFYKNLSKLPAKSITVALDACFSGGSARGMLIKHASPVFIEVKNPLAALKRAAVFTSSAGDQISSWYPEKRHGLFTYYYLKGLQGAADSDGDGKVTSGEMASYLKEEVGYMARRLAGREQNPQILGNKNAVLVHLK